MPFSFKLPERSIEESSLTEANPSFHYDAFLKLVNQLVESEPTLPKSNEERRLIKHFFNEMNTAADPIDPEALSKKYVRVLDYQDSLIPIISKARAHSICCARTQSLEKGTQKDQIEFLEATLKRVKFIGRILSILDKDPKYKYKTSLSPTQLTRTFFEDFRILFHNLSSGLYYQYYTEDHEQLASCFEKTFQQYRGILGINNIITHITDSAQFNLYYTEQINFLGNSFNRFRFLQAQYYCAIGNKKAAMADLKALNSSLQKALENDPRSKDNETLKRLQDQAIQLEEDLTNNKIRDAYIDIFLDIAEYQEKKSNKTIAPERPETLQLVLKTKINLLKIPAPISVGSLRLIKDCIRLLHRIANSKQRPTSETLEQLREMVTLMNARLEQDKGNILASRARTHLNCCLQAIQMGDLSFIASDVPETHQGKIKAIKTACSAAAAQCEIVSNKESKGPTVIHIKFSPESAKKSAEVSATLATSAGVADLEAENANIEKELAKSQKQVEQAFTDQQTQILHLETTLQTLEKEQTELERKKAEALAAKQTAIEEENSKKGALEARESQLKMALESLKAQIATDEMCAKQQAKKAATAKKRIESLTEEIVTYNKELESLTQQILEEEQILAEIIVPQPPPIEAEQEDAQLLALQEEITKLKIENAKIELELKTAKIQIQAITAEIQKNEQEIQSMQRNQAQRLATEYATRVLPPAVYAPPRVYPPTVADNQPVIRFAPPPSPNLLKPK